MAGAAGAGSRFNAAYAFFEPGFNFPLLPNNELVGVFKMDGDEEEQEGGDKKGETRKTMKK